MHDRRQQACQHVRVSGGQHEKSTHNEALPAGIECRDSAAVRRRNVLQRTTGGSERSVPIHTVFYHAITRMPFAKRLHVMLGGAPSGIVSRFTATLIGGGSALPLAIGAALLATLFYGFAVNYSKRHLAGVNAFVVAFGSQVSASILLVPLALFFWPKHSVAPSTWACVAALGVICTGFAYVLFFRLAERVGAAYAASVTFLIHIFGIIWGAAFLGEAITPVMIAGCAIVLFGTALASGNPVGS